MFKKIILSFFLIYGILGFFVLPYVLKQQVVEIVQKETNSKISVESIYFNPFVFNFKISGIKLSSLEDKHLVSLKSASFDLELYSLFTAAIHIKHFILEEPEVSVAYNKDKTINLTQILKPSKETKVEEKSIKEEMQLPRILVDRIAIVDGTLNYADFTHKNDFNFSFHRIGFELKDIDTDDFNSSDASLRFYSTLGDGGFLDLKSKVVEMKPLKVKGSLNFEASKLYTEWRYLQDMLNLEVADGKIAFSADYNFNLDNLEATTIHNLNLSLDKLRIKPKHKHKDVLNLEHFYVDDATIKPLANYVHISEVGLKSLNIKVVRDENGRVDWLDYIKTNSDASDTKQTAVKITVKKEKLVKWDVTLDKLSIQKVKVLVDDKGVTPNVDTNLNEFNLYAQDITLDGVKPFAYQMDMFLNKDFRCSSKGTITHNILNIESYSKCSGLDIAHYRPYIDEVAKDSLKTYNLKLLRATAKFDAKVDVKDIDSKIIVSVNDANFAVEKFALNRRSTSERLVNFNRFSVDGINVNTKDKDVVIKKSTLNNLDIRVKGYKDGTLSIDNIVVPKETKEIKKIKSTNTKAEKPYTVLLKHFAMQSAKAAFNDTSLSPNVRSTVDRINLNVYDINSKKNTWLKYKHSMRINHKGYITTNGSLRHTPLKQKGDLEIKEVSLKEVTPYIQKSAFVTIDDGYINLKSKLKYEVSEENPDLRMDGSFKLGEFFVNDSRDNSSLLSMNSLDLKSFNLELSPNRMNINEMSIDAFYVNAIIDEEKKINFAGLSKTQDSNETIETTQNNNSDINTTDNKPAFPFQIMKTTVSQGSAHFADLSLPIKFKTNIHDLGGTIYMISNEAGGISYVDILGEVDEYGSTKLKGSVNSSNPKGYTDLDFNFRNLELSSYSGYSATFAGYKIDSGKLYLDLGYKIFDSELIGKNNIMIKKIKLGEEVKEDSLPLGFVIALLEDSDGIIDIDMPVEGNVDEPDFKYGALVMKTMGNLIMKAVTSPFRFLGSMMGMDGEELESLDFEPALAVILPPEKEKLDMIAKMMIKRPKISLSIGGTYDQEVDKLAIQKQKLALAAVKKAKEKNLKDHENIMSAELLQEVYADMKPDNKLQIIKEKLEKEYKDEALQNRYLVAITNECVAIQPVEVSELQTLANTRAGVLKEYLVADKGINVSRINILKTDVVEDSDEKWVKTKLEVEVK